MTSVHPEQVAGSSHGPTPVTYESDPQFSTQQQQAQPPSYHNYPPYNTQQGPKPAWDYNSYPMSNAPYPNQQQMQQMQQQQPQVVVIGGGANPIQYQAVESFVGQIVISCLVLWFCNCLFGFIAFILAAVASSMAVSDSKQASHLGRASYILSGVGIVVTIVIVAIVVGVIFGSTASAISSIDNGCSSYYVNGRCYNYRYYVYSYSTPCTSSYYSSYYRSSDGYCYYNY